MNRRGFLKAGGAAALANFVPLPALLPAYAASPAAPAATLPVAGHLVKWAETIVRAHNSCTTAMLQRHLHLDVGVAQMLKDKLIADGVVAGQANAYGIHKAVKPLYDDAFMKPLVRAADPAEILEKTTQRLLDRHDPVEDETALDEETNSEADDHVQGDIDPASRMHEEAQTSAPDKPEDQPDAAKSS